MLWVRRGLLTPGCSTGGGQVGAAACLARTPPPASSDHVRGCCGVGHAQNCPTEPERSLSMPTFAYVGLDVSQDAASVCFLLTDGAEPVPRWTIPNTQPG